MSKTTGRYEAVVIGGGHNGLTCAAYLAAAGLEVCVLERSSVVGGAAITEEFHPGFRNSVASYTVSLLQPKIMRELGLAEHGLRIVPRRIQNFVPPIDGEALTLHAAPALGAAAIARHSKRDAERYPDFLAELGRITTLLKSTLLEPPLELVGGWRELARALRRGGRWRGLGREARGRFWDLMTGSAGHWLDAWFESDLLKGGLGFDAIVGHYASPYDAGSAYLLLHHALGEALGTGGGWGHAIGGMGAISEALAGAARARGVEIRVASPVAALRPGRRGYELSLADGTEIGARMVAAAIHPSTLCFGLLDPALLPDAFVARLKAWRSESASFRINVALAELPSFNARPGSALADHHTAGILIAPSLGYLDRAYLEARTDGYSRSPVVELTIPSTLDDTLAPPQAHVASLFCQHFARHPNQSWGEAKAGAVERILATVDAYAPNFRRSVLAVQALSPEDLEQRFGLVGGDIFHGQMSLDQLYWARPAHGAAQYRLPVPGLYLAASGAHPGGGVSGAPGHNAAQAMLADWRAGRC